MVQKNDLGRTPIPRLFFAYYLPVLTSMLSVTIHQVVDGLILGQKAGKEGVAAVGLYAPVLILFIAIELIIMIGGSILYAQYSGAKNQEKALEIFRYTTTLTILVGILIMVSTPFIVQPMAQLLAGKETGQVYQYTLNYSFWALLWLPFFLLRVLWANFTNNDQAPKVSRNATVIAAGVNIVLDVVFVMVLDWGVAGASIATGISVLVALTYIGVYIGRSKRNLTFQGFRLQWTFDEWRKLLDLGFPSFVSEISFAVGFFLINQSLLPYGNLAVSAFGIINYLSFIFLRFFTAAMITVQPIISFNVGAGKVARVLGILKFGLVFTFVTGAITVLVGWVAGEPLMAIFSGKATPAFYAVATPAIRLYFIVFIAAGANYVLSMYLQAIGKTRLSIIMNACKTLGFVVFFLWLLPQILPMELQGIWLARPLAEIATLLLIGGLTLGWKNKYYSEKVIIKKASTSVSD